MTAFETGDGPQQMPLAAAEASFGVRLPQLPDKCVDVLLTQRLKQSLLSLPCPLSPPGEPPGYMRLRRRLRSSEDVRRRRAALQLEQLEMPKGGEPWWVVAARRVDPWLGMCPRQGICEQLAQQLSGTQQQPAKQQGSGIDQQQQQQAPEAEAAEQEKVRSQQRQLGAADVASWGLRSACLGWDASSEAGGGWLLDSEWGVSSSGCASLPAGSHMPRVAPLVLAEPLDGCKGIRNAAMLRGAMAVVTRGRCSFLDKAMVADAVGAVGLVVLNMVPPGELLTMSGDDTGRSPDIPALLVGSEDSRALIWWLQHRPMMAALVALQDSKDRTGQAQQLQHGKDKQQQKQTQQQQGKGKGSSKDSEKQTRVDLFVPGRSQAWLAENIVKAGINPQSVFEQIVREPRVVAALQQAATARP
jgi:parvulin-like peptidyl-prolyl isomerase